MATAPTKPAKGSASPRQRKRRAKGGGAADDCFSCLRAERACDRRRPKCSQCLDLGQECGGYKTQLTWGNGVASRGKLRGLSLPVQPGEAKPPPKGRTVSPVGNAASVGNASDPDDDNSRGSPESSLGEKEFSTSPFQPSPLSQQQQHAVSAPATPLLPSRHDHLSISSRLEAATDWDPGFHPLGMPDGFAAAPSFGSFSPTTGLSFSFGDEPGSYVLGSCTPPPISPAAPPAPQRWNSPTSYPAGMAYHPAMTQGMGGQPTRVKDFAAAPGGRFVVLDRGLGGFGSTGEPGPYDSGAGSYQVAPGWAPQGQISNIQDARPYPLPTGLEPPPREARPESQSDMAFRARIPLLLDYYDRVVCPGLVVVDGPQNPYRSHVLQLAGSSPVLRHAVCAVAAGNMRMRRRLGGKQVRRRGEEEEYGGRGQDDDGERPLPEGQALVEEHRHRNVAAGLLNGHVHDPAMSTHESTLASILMLCHYRIMESGMAKFRSQLAGAKTILASRRRAQQQQQPGMGGDAAAWMEPVFGWLDALAAAVNNREAAPDGVGGAEANDAWPPLPPGAENVVGCDRELFRAIGRLGRLNMLAQGLGVHQRQHQQHQHQQQEQNFSSPFWCEWKEIRTALNTWEFDFASLQTALGCRGQPVTPRQAQDLSCLSEAFRTAALLYVQRLAMPAVPSLHPSLQVLVSKILYLAGRLDRAGAAARFLLWPLLVAGSECVEAAHRETVRASCRELAARWGYANARAVLHVLERVWAAEERTGEGGSPLRWVRHLERQGAVEWMFL